ncbi:MAG: class I SAM-dependent methyltransferase [Fervidobacterium sp.]
MKSDDYVVCDPAYLPFKDNTFKRVCGNAVLHHVLPSIKLVAKEFYRVLDNSGMTLFTGEIVASKLLGWLWKKRLERILGEGITTLAECKIPFVKEDSQKSKYLRKIRMDTVGGF